MTKTFSKKPPSDQVPAKKSPLVTFLKNKRVSKILKPFKKFKPKHYLLFGGLGFVLFIAWYGLQPLKGPIPMGICRVFAEMKVKYPKTMKLTQFIQIGSSFRLYYTSIGAYGVVKSETIECVFKQTNAGVVIESIKINRKSIPDAEVAAFSQTMAGIIAGGPNLILPVYKSDALVDLKKDE